MATKQNPLSSGFINRGYSPSTGRTSSALFDRNDMHFSKRVKILFYRLHPWNGGVVFAQADRAQLVNQIYEALSSAKTWGEFRRLMPSQEYRKIRKVFDEQCEPRPRLDEEFSAEYVAGFSDGDYPPWLQAEMDIIIPNGILRQFGKYEATSLNGSYWHITEDHMKPMADAMRERGFEVLKVGYLKFH